jgi:hypothetical protein
MSGFMEILLILALILGIFMLPRLLSRNQEQRSAGRGGGFKPRGWTRLAIVASLVWPALALFFMQPWNGHWVSFLYTAIGPVALIWGIVWVSSGFLRDRR